MFFSNTAVPFTLPPTVQLRFRVFYTVPACVLIWEGTVVDNREPSTGLETRELQLHLLEDKPPGGTSLWHSSPTLQDFMDSSQVGPREPYRAGPPYNKHYEILTLVFLISQRNSNKLTNFHGVQQCLHKAHNEPRTLLYQHKAFQALITQAWDKIQKTTPKDAQTQDTIFSFTVSDPGQTLKSPKTVKKRDHSSCAHGPVRPQHLPWKHSRFSWYRSKCTWNFLHWQPQAHSDTKVDAKNDLRCSLLLYGVCLLKEPIKATEWSGWWGHLLEPAQAQGSHPPAPTGVCGINPGHSSNSGKDFLGPNSTSFIVAHVWSWVVQQNLCRQISASVLLSQGIWAKALQQLKPFQAGSPTNPLPGSPA